MILNNAFETKQFKTALSRIQSHVNYRRGKDSEAGCTCLNGTLVGR